MNANGRDFSATMIRTSFALATVAALAACTDNLPLDGRPCPCVSGQTCTNGRCMPSPDPAIAPGSPVNPDRDGGSVSPGPDAPAAQPVSSAAAATVVGVWAGYVLNRENRLPVPGFSYTFTVTIRQDAAGALGGTLRFGTGPDLLPPTNFDVAYPPGWFGMGGPGYSGVAEGFDYTLRSVRLDDRRLQFGVSTFELWPVWCSHQTPIADVYNPGRYKCAPNGSVSCREVTGTGIVCYLAGQPIDYGKLELCMSPVCTCDSVACRVASYEDSITFDLFLDGENASGASTQGDVRLARRP
jgi:hypothetical protein